MADGFRTRTRNFLGLDPLKGEVPPAQRSAYNRFTTVGPDTTRRQLIGGAALYTLLTVFCISLVLGSTGLFGRIVFAVFGVLCFLFSMQRFVPLLNGTETPGRGRNAGTTDDGDPDAAPTPPAPSRRTGGTASGKKTGGARRSGDPRRSD